MRFNINKSELLNALTIVSKGTASRSTIPVLSGVYIKAEGMGLVMETTDLERSIRYSVPALVEEEGTTVIPEKLLLDIVKNLPEAAVESQTNDSTVTVSCGKSSFTLKTLDAADFPPFPNVDVSSSIEAPFAQFCSMVKRVAKVVSKDQSRAVLTGVLISTSEEGLRMVATDSYRLAVADIALEGVQENFEAIVSGVFLQEVAGLPKMEENITIGLTANQIVFTYQNMVLINRRIEGNFPNYRQIIPQSWATKTCFTTQELMTAVKRVGLVSALSSPVKIDINAEAGNAIINAATQDVGSAEEVVGCEVAGESIQIALNHQYVLDGLMSVSTDQVFFETTSPMKPGIFRAGAGENFLYLVMPVRVSYGRALRGKRSSHSGSAPGRFSQLSKPRIGRHWRTHDFRGP